jgi:outer membrane scaffolding protein for murein synthesis (MipA/OmpV family)
MSNLQGFRRRAPFCVGCLAAVVAIAASTASAAPELVDAPLWEAGVGLGAVVFPVYRGAAVTSFYALPIPYIVYRGTLLRADHNGANLEFIDHDAVQLRLSADAGPPVKSSDVTVRGGMPDLRPTAEFGPSLELRLWRSPDDLTRVSAQLPLRAAVAVEWTPRVIGAVGAAFLNVDRRNAFGCQGCNLGLRLGPMFQTRDYDDYYYGVDPQYARTGRPAYAASGGYAGMQYLGSASKRFAHSWVGAFIRYDSLDGASFVGSPLVQSRHYLAVGIGFSWILRTSTETVRINPDGD